MIEELKEKLLSKLGKIEMFYYASCFIFESSGLNYDDILIAANDSIEEFKEAIREI